jgi:hypothetical protein
MGKAVLHAEQIHTDARVVYSLYSKVDGQDGPGPRVKRPIQRG